MTTNLKLLNDIIDNSGLKKSYIARFLGITKASLYNKLSGKTEFSVSEANKLRILLHLSDRDMNDIFFSSDVTVTTIIEGL